MVNVTLDASQVVKLARGLIKQFPYATSKSLNEVAILFQKVQRRHQTKSFRVRRKQWWSQAVKIPRKDGFASHKKGRLEARVITDPKADREGTKHYDIFWRQEFDRSRTPILNRKDLTIPREGAKLDSTGVVRRPERPKRVMAKKGFIVPFKGGKKGMFRRTGKRSKSYTTAFSLRARGGGSKVGLKQDPNVEFMYLLIPKGKIDPVYSFFENAERVWRGNWERALDKNIRQAFRTAK